MSAEPRDSLTPERNLAAAGAKVARPFFGDLAARGEVTLLVCDDEAAIRELLARWLTAEGFTCEYVESAEHALAKLEQREFALLLNDIGMPGISGIELLKRVRQSYPDLAVLMVTGMNDRKLAIHTLEMGAYGYVTKPFDRNEIIINVLNALERRRLAVLSRNHQEELEREVRLRTADIRRREEELALRLVSASEYRDNETGAHIRRLGLYSAVLAEALGWSAAHVDDIRVAASMHDIGKIGVPDGILLKPARLTPDEFEIMKRHTEIGAGILGGSDIPLLQMAREIAQSHHERWDGRGYPQGLVGSEIPAAACIVAVADVYDALVHRRVYKPAFSEEETLAIMMAERQRHFDPRVFDVFLEVLPQFREIRLHVQEGISQRLELPLAALEA